MSMLLALSLGLSTLWAADIDGDGYAEVAQDCDDTGAICPAAPEFCELTDQDCDGQVDEPDPKAARQAGAVANPQDRAT